MRLELLTITLAVAALFPSVVHAQSMKECERRLSLTWKLKPGDELMSGKLLLIVFKGDQDRLAKAQRSVNDLVIFATHESRPSRFDTTAIIPLYENQALLVASMQPFAFEVGQTGPLTRRLCEIAAAYAVEADGWSVLNGSAVAGGEYQVLPKDPAD